MRKKRVFKIPFCYSTGYSPKRFWFACGISLGLVSLPLSTFANNWSGQQSSAILKSVQQNRIITGNNHRRKWRSIDRRFRIDKRNYSGNSN